MVREFRWRLKVRSYEGDAWGLVPAGVMLRYMEQSAVMAAADAGYGRQFHEAHGSAWVIRRMTLLMQTPARPGDELEVVTWASHFTRVRGIREYRVTRLADEHTQDYGAGTVALGIAEWVYVDRRTLTPLPIPATVARDLDVPGSPVGSYEPPPVPPTGKPRTFTMQRVAEWHEADSMGHVNNSVYADWLDDAVRAVLNEIGPTVRELKELGLQLRGEYYNLDYKRAALPEDRVTITTHLEGASSEWCAFRQTVEGADGTPLLLAHSVYGWRTAEGHPASPPPEWANAVRHSLE